ncbi:MAG: XRE family transcriptional regulator [Comamonadaceae bacterium]|nr:XRE family transcriptional regulator [Comamonadaceae bacterium]
MANTLMSPPPDEPHGPQQPQPGPGRHDAAFGAAVRSRRAEIGITLEQLAEATGISRSALSRIERGALATSLNYGLAIAQALGRELPELLGQGGPAGQHITRAADGVRYVDPATGVQRQALARPAPGVEWVAYTLPVGAQTSAFAPHGPGTRETFHVVSGAVEIELEGQAVRLGPGDTATLRADVAHRFRNAGRSVARVMLIVAEPRA